MTSTDDTTSDLAGPAGRLVVVCGLPGSGKTTLAARLAAERGGVRFAPDEWLSALGMDLWDSAMRERVESLQWAVAHDVMGAGGTAVIEWGTWTRAERDRLRSEARARGWAVELWFLEVPVEELSRRIRARNREDPPIQGADLRRWVESFEPPDDEELSLYDAPGQPASMLRIGSVVLQVSDVSRAASFWRKALRYVATPGNPAFLAPECGAGPRLHLDEDDRMHLDLWTAGRTEQLAEVERLVSLGAGRVEWEYPDDADFVVLSDTEGNLFCVIDAGS